MPILIAGLLFKHAIEGSLRNLWITVTVLALFGVLLWVVDARSKQVKTMKEMTWKDALIFGIGQMLALIPGVSRSGGTITFGRAMGYTREAAVRVSFLMAIPAVFGAGIWKPYRPSRTLPRGMPVCSPAGVLPSPQPSWHLWSLRGDHRLPEVCFHLLVQGIRHLPHRLGDRRGIAADYRRAFAAGSRSCSVNLIR